ncbi:ABC transporter permease [Williamsia sterculiae]|uniref:ABC-2 type transport system permease protein n=1 Tax=Williamsia sterculiae TaxID=1344003 RepID=A0A1N7GQP1_9NOCA|nr:ABC transporter permease [Williamsia sterculiae]SIS14840.1 ABC-2 type transport system permease protein [Williamsia sterculiae]
MTATSSTIGLVTGFDAAARVTAWGQWRALTGRALRSMYRQGEFVLAIASPAMLTICYYVPLRKIMNIYAGMDYSQYLMPIICLQSVGFVATSSAMRAATDGSRGVTTRLRSMPIHPAVPFLSRLSANAVLLAVSLLWAFLSGLAIGWRPQHGVGNFLGFVVVAMLMGIVLSFAADVLGSMTNNPAATSQAMALPQLILGMLSTGLLPEQRFPDWIRGFVRNQPISQLTDLLRAFDRGAVHATSIVPAAGWVVGLLLLGAVAAAYSSWRSNHR